MCAWQHPTTFIPPFTETIRKRKKNWWFSWRCWFCEWLDSTSSGQWFYPLEKLQHIHMFFFFSGNWSKPATKFRIIALKISRRFTLNHCGIASVTSNAIPGACFQADFAFTVVGHLSPMGRFWLWLVLGWRWNVFFLHPPKKNQRIMCLLVGSWQPMFFDDTSTQMRFFSCSC